MGLMPCSFAHSALAMMMIELQSQRAELLPAVIVPPSFLKMVGSLASCSSDVSARKISSVSITISPFLRSFRTTGTISSLNSPALLAAAAF